jgi:hypothetical protein
MGWLDNWLRELEPAPIAPTAPRGTVARPWRHPTSSPEGERPHQPKPDIKMVWVTTRSPLDDGDPGEAQCGYYSVEHGVVRMHDEKGKPTGKEHRLSDGKDPRLVAGRITRAAWHSATPDFNRPLVYARGGYA